MQGLTPCQNWTGEVTEGGYGRWRKNGSRFMVHRLAWEEVNGEIPEGMFILHICDNRLCVNPDHLRLGTAQDNTLDMYEKGRGCTGRKHGRAKLNEGIVEYIRRSALSQEKLAAMFGVTHSTIGRAKRGDMWKYDAPKRKVGDHASI